MTRLSRAFCKLVVFATLLLHSDASFAGPPRVVDVQGNVTTFYGVPLSLTRSQLKRLPYKVTTGHYFAEGDRYTKYTIKAEEGIAVDVEFNEDGSLYVAKTQSRRAIAVKGVGVGSTLAEVKTAWPSGQLIFGFEDGAFVTFVTGSNVLLRFNPADMPPGAFDHERPRDFPVPLDIRVKTLSIFPRPIPISGGQAPTDPDKNEVTISTGGKVINRLGVERIEPSGKVRLTWFEGERVVYDRTVDTSAYPDFDIWSRDLLRHPNPVAISFRYGNFKNCDSKEEDRDQVFVTLDGDGASLSPRVPAGIPLGSAYGLPKYVGDSMTSQAHGCRRTYNPQTGAFGLAKVEE